MVFLLVEYLKSHIKPLLTRPPLTSSSSTSLTSSTLASSLTSAAWELLTVVSPMLRRSRRLLMARMEKSGMMTVVGGSGCSGELVRPLPDTIL